MVKKNLCLSLLLLSFLWLAENNHVNNFYSNENGSRIELLNSDIYNSSIEINIDSYELIEDINKKGYYTIEVDKGSPMLEKGAPNLPKLNTSIIIPDDKWMEVFVSDFEFEEVHDINILPSKGNFSREIDPSTIPYSFSEIYKENKFYPENLVEMRDPYILRDLRGQGVVIYPFQYNPMTKTLRVYTKMTLEIESTNKIISSNKNKLIRQNNNYLKQSAEFKNIYQNLFINYNSDTRFDYIDDLGNMLIITYDDFIDEMAPFVEWKNKKGIPTEIVGLNSIGNTANDMQDYIDNYYYDNGLTYLLLVGDINQMPTHMVSGSASDPTFGFIEGNDSFSEIIVGRFSANNPSELITQVERTLQYEQDPSANIEHFNQALGVASTQGPGYGGLTDAQFNDLLWNDFLSEFTYTDYTGLYDGSGSVSQGVSAINDGVGIINYTGHAGPTGWGNGAPLGVNDVNGLTNANKLPFIFTVGCNPGQFNDYSECFCEAWMRATDSDGNPTGAIGHLGSTISQSWTPPMHGQWAMNAILSESYEGNITRSYGGIAVNGCMHMNEAQGSGGINETKYWTLFGDPSLMIRTDAPEELDISFDNVLMVGQSELVVDVGVEGALAALSIDGVLKSYAQSVGGVAILDLTEVTVVPGDVDLVISAFNKYPYQETMSIIAPEGAYLLFDNYDIIGNGDDDTVDYGDEIELNITVSNVGVDNTNALNVVVTTDNEHIIMNNSNSMIAYAIAGQTATIETPISFSVLHSIPDQDEINFNISIEDGEDFWNLEFSIIAQAPVFEVLNPVIVDENMDGIWSPGEEATIFVDLANSGSAGFGWYPGAVITTDNSFVTILSNDNSNTFYGIDAETIYQGMFYVIADDFIPLNYSEVDFNISWGYSTTAPCEGDCVQQANLFYEAIIGQPSECSIGDVNSDGNIDVTDIIRQVNIIINFGASPSESELCASDVNVDGSVNVLDVLAVVNYILYDRFEVINDGIEPIENTVLSINNNNLTLVSEGMIKGAQFIIQSEVDELIINNKLGMDIAYNKVNDIHYIVIYSLTGNYISKGQHQIFNSNQDFTIIDSIISNSNNNPIEILYDDDILYPHTFVLKQNYPNPFNPTTQIEFELGASENIDLLIFDINGRKIKELASGYFNKGVHAFTWDSKDDLGNTVASGMYIYSLISNDNISTQKMLLLK